MTDPETNLAICEQQREMIRRQLLQGVARPEPARIPDNPNRILVRYLAPVVSALDKKVAEVEAYLAWIGGDPGQTLNWRNPLDWPAIMSAYSKASTIDLPFTPDIAVESVSALNRLRDRVDYYQQALKDAAQMSDADQRAFLAPRVFSPIFLGARFKDVRDPESGWIQTVSDWCEPVIIARNLRYTHEDLRSYEKQIRQLWSATAETFQDGWHFVADTAGRIGSGFRRGLGLAPIAFGVLALVAISNMGKGRRR